MDDMFKTETLRSDNLLPLKSKNLEQISDCPPVPKPKALERPKVAKREENKVRPVKRPAKEDGPGTEAAFARWENPVDLNDFIEPVPESADAFDALMGERRRQVGEKRVRRGKRQSSSRGRGGSRTPRHTDPTINDLARSLLMSDISGRDRTPPPPFRGI